MIELGQDLSSLPGEESCNPRCGRRSSSATRPAASSRSRTSTAWRPSATPTTRSCDARVEPQRRPRERPSGRPDPPAARGARDGERGGQRPRASSTSIPPRAHRRAAPLFERFWGHICVCSRRERGGSLRILTARPLTSAEHAFSVLNMRSVDDLTATARIRDAAIEQFGQHGFDVGAAGHRQGRGRQRRTGDPPLRLQGRPAQGVRRLHRRSDPRGQERVVADRRPRAGSPQMAEIETSRR